MEGGENRSVGATAMNDVSSRSHAIFTVNLKITAPGGDTTKAKFHLVDLAGSERSKKTKATGTRFKEGVKINQGLLALGNVISALGGGSGSANGYISYRDSKLTRLLQDSLGGNSVTLMIACISPADYNIEETLSTLRYADRAKKIKNKPVKNQDSHESEVAKLKDIIHDLRVKLLERIDTGEGRKRVSVVIACGEDCEQRKRAKEAENSSLRQQCAHLVNVVNSLNSLHLLEETFCTELIERFEKLRALLLNTCQAEFASPDTKIFEEIAEHTKAIEGMISNFKQQVSLSPVEDEFEESHIDDAASNQKMLEYTATQMKTLKEIKTLEREMKIKQELLDRKFVNVPFLSDEAEKTISEYQNQIKNLEKELGDLKASGGNNARRADHNATKVNMDRKHKIDKLEKDLEETRKKCVNLEKTKKLAEQDRKRIDDLRREIQEMKTARVQLIRQQRSDADMYKKWIASRDKEINTLKEKGKKVQNEMKRMERMHEKQQTVLKRKVEEAKAVNKRLQDAMDRNKKVQAMRQSTKTTAEKTDVIQTYIDHELMVLMSTIDAKIAMQSLMNDRGLLTERLMNLKSTVNKTEALEDEIKQLEEDLEMRNTQITEIRQKVMQTDLDAKLKSIPDNFTTAPELKIAMGYVIRALLDVREDFTSTKMKAEDLKVTYETSEERIEALNEEIRQERENHTRFKSEMERDFETKLTFLCRIGNDGECERVTKENEPAFKVVMQQLNKKMRENNDLHDKVAELEEEIRTLKSSKKKPKKRNPDGTYVLNQGDSDVELFESDEDEDFNFDDSFQDPEWRKTPARKRSKTSKTTNSLLKESVINRMDGTGVLNDISEASETSGTKRSISGIGKCSCKGSCATKQCGCKKNGNFCSDSCKCSDACVNVPDESKESGDDDDEMGYMEKENADDNDDDQNSPKRSK